MDVNAVIYLITIIRFFYWRFNSCHDKSHVYKHVWGIITAKSQCKFDIISSSMLWLVTFHVKSHSTKHEFWGLLVLKSQNHMEPNMTSNETWNLTWKNQVLTPVMLPIFMWNESRLCYVTNLDIWENTSQIFNKKNWMNEDCQIFYLFGKDMDGPVVYSLGSFDWHFPKL